MVKASKIINRKTGGSYLAWFVVACSALLLPAGCGNQKPKPPVVATVQPSAPPSPINKPVPPAVVNASPSKATWEVYFPLSKGNQWTMRETFETASHLVTITAIGESVLDGKPVYLLETKRDGKHAMLETYSADDTQILRRMVGPDGKDRLSPPMPVMKLPLQNGDGWTWNGNYIDSSGTKTKADAVFLVFGPEEVKTPVGNYNAYRINQEFAIYLPDGKKTFTNIQWFAPTVGLVKQTTLSASGQMTSELTDRQPESAKTGALGPSSGVSDNTNSH